MSATPGANSAPESFHLRLPADRSNSYREYDLHLSTVLKWMVLTAAQLPEESKSFPTTPERGAQKKKRHTKQDSSSPRVTPDRFLHLAKQIKANNVAVPQAILCRLVKITLLRKRAVLFFSTDYQSPDAWKMYGRKDPLTELFDYVCCMLVADDVEVLEECSYDSEEEDDVVEALRQAALADGNEDDPLQNEWLRDILIMSKKKQQKWKAKKPKEYPVKEYQLVMDEDADAAQRGECIEADILFASLCFFKDVNAIRGYCINLWRQVEPDGTASRISVAMVTNEAVALVSRLERELQVSVGMLNVPNVYDVVTRYFPSIEELAGSATDITMLCVYDQIKRCQRDFEESGSFSPPQDECSYDFTADRGSMSWEEREKEDEDILKVYLSHLAAAIQYPNLREGLSGYPVCMFDPLAVHFREFLTQNGRPISMALVFCLQLYLDILHINRWAGSNYFKTMKTLVYNILNDWSDFLAFTEDTPLQWKEFHSYRTILESASVVISEQYEKPMHFGYMVLHRWNSLTEVTGAKDLLWTMNPWLCANSMVYTLLFSYRECSNFFRDVPIVRGTMHLWNMLVEHEVISAQETPNGTDPFILDYLVARFGMDIFPGNSRPTKESRGFLGAYNRKPQGCQQLSSHMLNLFMIEDKFKEWVHPKFYLGNDPAVELDAIFALIEGELGKSMEPLPLVTLNFWKIYKACVQYLLIVIPRFRHTFKGESTKALGAVESIPEGIAMIIRDFEKYGKDCLECSAENCSHDVLTKTLSDLIFCSFVGVMEHSIIRKRLSEFCVDPGCCDM